MKRRQFIRLIGGAAAAWPLAAFAQDARKPPLIGYLSGGPLAATTSAGMFRQGLKDLGYAEDRDFHITYRSSDGYQDRLPALAEELVRLNPDVLIGAGLDAVVALRNVTQTIPIVSATLADAVHLGLIANEARPTGNVTGIEPYVAGLPAKQMEFAREIMPGASKIGLLANLSDPKAPPQAQELLAAGRGLEVEVTSSDANRPAEIESALQMLASRPVDIVIVLQTSMLLGNSRQIAALALAKRLPTFYETALMSPPAGSPAMVWIWSGAGAVPPLSWTRSSTGLDRATCRSSFRQKCCWRSTSKLPKLLASLCRRLCSFGPTR
jgi:putative tryptophan/tyrosine transport system substrate-binding protein